MEQNTDRSCSVLCIYAFTFHCLIICYSSYSSGKWQTQITMNAAALLPLGFHSQTKIKNGRTSMLFPPLFLGKYWWPVENFIPRRSQVGIIRKSHGKNGWRCTILLTNILHSMGILYHCSLYNFVSFSKKGSFFFFLRANWYYISHCLFPPSLTSRHKMSFFLSPSSCFQKREMSYHLPYQLESIWASRTLKTDIFLHVLSTKHIIILSKWMFPREQAEKRIWEMQL